MNHDIKDCLSYFAQFSYAPSFDEIYTFLKTRTTKHKLQLQIRTLLKAGQLKAFKLDTSENYRYYYPKNNARSGKYTLGEYSITSLELKTHLSKLKREKTHKYIKVLSMFPQIKLVGISGSVAMMNAKESDDIDLFIIAASHRIWSARFIAIILSQCMGIRRKYGDKKAQDKVCLNLFFDEQNLAVPSLKRSEYVAHEVLQMKPVVIKDDTYRRYLDSNRWVYDIFPNTNLELRCKNSKLTYRNFSFLGSALEIVLKKLQLLLIHRHRTSELISDTQLWFHPDDYAKKVTF